MDNFKKVFRNIFNSSSEEKMPKVKKKENNLPKMPKEEDLHKQFEEFMSKMSMPPQTREKMRNLPASNKWLLICQSKIPNTDDDKPKIWIERLNTQTDRVDILRKFRIVISTKEELWMKEFVKLDGLLTLVKNNIRKDHGNDVIEIECLKCLKAFMNSEYGLTAILSNTNIFSYLEICLTSTNKIICQLIMDLFTVICWISDEGHNIVCSALKNSQGVVKSKTHFSLFIDILKLKESDLEMKISVLTLINAVINSFHDLDERTFQRNFLIDDGLIDILKDMSKWANDCKNDRAFLIIAQIDVFEKELERDFKETQFLNIDLNDIESIWNFIKDMSKNSGSTAYLIDCIKYFLIVSNIRRTRKKMWLNCQYALRLATAWVKDQKDIETLKKDKKDIDIDSKNVEKENNWIESTTQNSLMKDTRLLKYTEIETLLKNYEQTPEEEDSSNKDSEIIRKEFHEYKVQKEAEIDKYKEMLKSGSKIETGESSLKTDSSVPAPPVLDSGLGPPPPLDSSLGPPPVLDSGLGPPPPLDSGLGPPPPLSGGLGPPPPLGGGLGAPPALAVKKDFLPPKPNKAPKVKMRNFHWGIIHVNKIEGTVWERIKDDTIQIDVEKFSEMFQSKPAVAPKRTTSFKKKVETVSLIDSKRSTNTEIALSRFKMSPEAIRDAILMMDNKKLDLDKIQKLFTLVPTPEEAETCLSYDGDEKLLSITEKFFRVVGKIKMLKPRLEIFAFYIQFDSVYDETMKKIDLVQNCCNKIKGNKKLSKLLSIILKHGNYMNGGTKKGGAYGFKLSALKQLNSTKSLDNKTTLMQYIVLYIEKNHSDIYNLNEDFSILSEVAKIESQMLQSEVNKIKANVSKLGNMLQSASNDPGDRFKPIMKGFFDTAADKVAKMHSSLEKAEKDTDELSVSYGEISGRIKFEVIFKMFEELITSFVEGKNHWKKMKETEAKSKKRMKYRQDKTANTNKMKSKGAADNILANLRQTEAGAISQEILKRRMAKK